MKPHERTVVYEPHPVSPARKAELMAQGYRIVDAVFDPDPKSKSGKADKPKPETKPKD